MITQVRHTLRVALVAPSLRRSAGGQAVQAQLLLEHWRCEPAVEVRFVPINPPFPSWLAWLEQVRFVRTLVRTPLYLAKLWPAVGWADVVHVFSASYWSFVLAPVPALVLAHLRGKKVILNYRSGEAPDHLRRWRTALFFLRKADQLVVPSGYLAGVFREFRLRTNIIPNLVDFDQFIYRPRHPLRRCLLCTRNLEPYYGVDVVIRAFGEVKRHFPSASLCLAGSGSQAAFLRQLVHDLGLTDVQFAGTVPRGEISRFYDQADIFVNGSRLDNVPVSILEAFASGLPVVTTAPGGMKYVVDHERTGLLSAVDDWQALAASVLRLLRDPALAVSLAQNAYSASTRYRWTTVRELWLDAYRSVLVEKKTRPRKSSTEQEEEARETSGKLARAGALGEDTRAPIMQGRDIICFANDWQADPLSKKHLMLRLARDNRILWVNSLHNRRPRLARKDARRVVQKVREFFRGLVNVHPNIWALTPLYIPFLRYRWIRSLNRVLLQGQLRLALRRLRFRRPITWTFVPTSAEVVGRLGESCVIYHCVDEFAAFSDAAVNDVRQAEQLLLRKADVVLTASQPLWERKRSANEHTYLVPHGVDYDHFRRATLASTPIAPELRTLPRPILGFHGLVADWVDVAVLAEVARRRPHWSLVLVGRIETNVDGLRTLPNVHLLGHRPYAKLPEYLRGFDIALLPFVEGELTHCANPLKLREYLAAGLPVVSSPLPEAARFEPLVRMAHTADEYIRQIEALLQQGQTGPSAERSEQVAGESWDQRVKQIEALLEPWLSSPLAKDQILTAAEQTTEYGTH